MPLVYVLYGLFDRLHSHWDGAFPTAQAGDFYIVTGLLWGIPIAIWSLALVLVLIGTANRALWATVCVGGFAIAAYGALVDFDVGLGLNLNPVVAFGLYAGLLGLWQLLWRRGRRPSEPVTPASRRAGA